MSGPDNYNDLCRTCSAVTQANARQYIFEHEGILHNIPLKLKKLQIQITQNDNLPKVMCEPCIYKLDIVHDFIVKIRRTEIHLNNLLHYQATVIKVEPDICAYSQDTEVEQSQIECNSISNQSAGNNLLNFKEESVESAYGTHFLDSQCTPKQTTRQVIGSQFVTPTGTYQLPNTPNSEPISVISNESQIISHVVNQCQSISIPPVYDVEADTDSSLHSNNVTNNYMCSVDLNEPPMFYLCRFCRLPFPSHDAANVHILEVHKKEQRDKNLHELVPQEESKMQTELIENTTVQKYILNKNPIDTIVQSNVSVPPVDNNEPSTSKVEKRTKQQKSEYIPPFFACTSCYIVFPSNDSLVLHMQDHKPLPECKVCGVKFSCEELLKNHMQKDDHVFSPQENKVWRCSECSKECRKKCKIQNHMRVHTGERPFTCNFCPKAFPIKAQLTMHERKHKNDWCYVCNYCGKGFYVKVYFDNHVRTTHTKEKPFKCDKCEASYASKASLKEHILSKHNDGSLPIRIYECKSCGKKFKDNNSLYYHNKTHAASLEERRKHKCLVCGASFVKNHYLRKHMKIHTGENIEKFECHLCGKKLATSHGLDLHLVIHSGIKNFICDFCGKAFASESTLKTHIRCHTGEKPYQCRVCSNFFTQRSSLLSHLKNIHNIDDRIRKIKVTTS